MASELLKTKALAARIKEPKVRNFDFGLNLTSVESLIPDLPEPKPQELLDIQEDNRKGRLLESLNKIGGRLEDTSLDFINRENFADKGLATITANIRGKPVTYQRKSKLGQIDTKKRNIIKQFILDDIEDFEKNFRKFPNEKYQLNRTKIVEKLRNNNINTSFETVDDVIKNISPKDKKRFSVIEVGQSSASILPDNEKNFFAENYKTKNIAQMATEITGKPNDNKTTKAKAAQLYRHFLTQSKMGNIIKEDLVRGKSIKGTGSGNAFEDYRKAQQNLMNLDPKVYKKLTPAKLDNQLKKALQFSTIKGAFDVPPSLVPSFEHFQGLVPSTITQEPLGLRKVGITTKDYNFNVMGAKAKKGMYKIIKDNIRTSKAFLREGKIDEAKKSLNTVNQIYDDVAKKLKTIDRKKLPKYSLSGDNIKEINLKAVNLGTEKRLSNTIEDYIRFVATGPKKDIAKIKKQPNLIKAIEMIQKGEDDAVKNLIKSRIPNVKAGELFGGIPLPVLEKTPELLDFRKLPKDFKNVSDEMIKPLIDKGKIYGPKYAKQIASMARPAAKLTGLELLLGSAFAPLDIGEGRPMKDVALNVATLGMGVPVKDAKRASAFADKYGLKEDLFTAKMKLAGANKIRGDQEIELTNNEEKALQAETYFKENILQPELDELRTIRQEESDPMFGLTDLGMAEGGRINYSNGSDGTDLAIKESLEAFERYLKAGGKLGYKDFIALGNEGVSKFFNKGGRVNFASGSGPMPVRLIYIIMDRLRNLKNSTFSNYNQVRMYGEQKGITELLEPYKNIPNKNRVTSAIDDAEELKKFMPDEYKPILDEIIDDTKQFKFKTAHDKQQALEKVLPEELKFENLPEEMFPMPNPENPNFIMPYGYPDKNPFQKSRITTRTEADKFTGKGTRKTYDTFNEETKQYQEPSKNTLISEEPIDEELESIIRDLDKGDLQ